VGESDPHAIAILGHLLFLSGFPCLGRVTGEYACLLSPDDPDVWAQLARGWSVRDSFLDLDPERQKASQEILSISQGLADKTASGSPARLWD